MISVIIPVFNCVKYVERCFLSVLGQSFSDIELIAVDDGSTDGSGKLCDDLARSDGRVKVVHTENGGVAAARNIGLGAATGDLITFVDADDYIPNDYLQSLFDTLADADIAVCDIVCRADGKEVKRFTCNRTSLSAIEATELLLSRREINSGPCGKLFKKSVIGGSRFPSMKIYEDILFVLEVFDKANTLKCTANTAYIYDISTGGAMAKSQKYPTTDALTMAERVFSYLDGKVGVFGPQPEYVTFSYLMQLLRDIESDKAKTDEQRKLSRAITDFFAANRKRILHNAAFGKKEKLVFFAASYNLELKDGIRRINK